jgi:hypothetical protein
MTDKPTKDVPTTEEILALERRVWEALVAGNPKADMAMLSGDFLGVYPSGFANRDQHGEELSDGPTMARYDLSEARLMPLADGLVLLAYRADFTRAGRDAAEAMYISSIWRRQGDGWLNCFSQDSMVE